MPPPLNRFPSGPNTISPYHQQFPSHAQHATSHPPPLGATAAYLNAQVGQVNPFSGNSNLLGLAGGLNAATGFGVGVGADSGLASHAARLGFAHAGSLQQQQQSQQQALQQQQQQSQHTQHAPPVQHPQHAQPQGHGLVEHATRAAQKGRIREVWKHNLHEEFANLRDLVDRYPYIAMVGGGLWSAGGSGFANMNEPFAGHRVSGRRSETDGRLSREKRLPLPMPTYQRGPIKGHTDRHRPL